jgi:hypothetical protein
MSANRPVAHEAELAKGAEEPEQTMVLPTADTATQVNGPSESRSGRSGVAEISLVGAEPAGRWIAGLHWEHGAQLACSKRDQFVLKLASSPLKLIARARVRMHSSSNTTAAPFRQFFDF